MFGQRLGEWLLLSLRVEHRRQRTLYRIGLCNQPAFIQRFEILAFEGCEGFTRCHFAEHDNGLALQHTTADTHPCAVKGCTSSCGATNRQARKAPGVIPGLHQKAF